MGGPSCGKAILPGLNCVSSFSFLKYLLHLFTVCCCAVDVKKVGGGEADSCVCARFRGDRTLPAWVAESWVAVASVTRAPPQACRSGAELRVKVVQSLGRRRLGQLSHLFSSH